MFLFDLNEEADQVNSILGNLVISKNGFKNVQNAIQMKLKW